MAALISRRCFSSDPEAAGPSEIQIAPLTGRPREDMMYSSDSEWSARGGNENFKWRDKAGFCASGSSGEIPAQAEQIPWPHFDVSGIFGERVGIREACLIATDTAELTTR